MSERPFTFENCPDPQACRTAMRPLLAANMDWSEIHCGLCDCQGIVRHADIDAASAELAPVPIAEPRADPADPEDPAANAADTGRAKA